MNILYVPVLTGRLIYIKELMHGEYEVVLHNGKSIVIKNGQALITATEQRGLFAVNMKEVAMLMSEEKQIDCIYIWHNRLGHKDLNALKQMHKFEAIKRFILKPCSIISKCECCIQSKMTRKPFPTDTANKAVN